MPSNHIVVVRLDHDDVEWTVNTTLWDEGYPKQEAIEHVESRILMAENGCAGCAVKEVLHVALNRWGAKYR